MLEDLAKEIYERLAPPLKHEGAKQVCKAINSDTIREILVKHHDEYGEFNYEAAIKDIRKIAIDKAKSLKEAIK